VLLLTGACGELQVKHRKAELAQERGGIIASIGQTIAGPRFYETDEVSLYYLGAAKSLSLNFRLSCPVVRPAESIFGQP
jgi:hypothetical protein